MYHQHPAVQIVSQVLIEVPTDFPLQTFRECRTEALRWAENRARRKLPPEAWWGHSFDLKNVGTQPVSAVAIDDYWTARIDDADKNVPQRTWITEIGIGIDPGEENLVTFGCRLYCRDLGENPPFSSTIPGVVMQIADNLHATADGQTISTSAWRVHDESTVDQLVDFMLEPSRQRSVIVVASPLSDQPPMVNADGLAKSLVGVAHVASITEDASFILTERVGREFSVFNGAVRTYRTGFFPDADQPSAHPLALYDKVRNWSPVELSFHDFLVKKTMEIHLSSRHIQSELPSFASIRAAASKKERERLIQQGASDSDLLQLALSENGELRQELEEEKHTSNSLISIAEGERDSINSQLDLSRQINYNLQRQIEGLQVRLAESGSNQDEDIPEGLDDVQSWCERHLGANVFMLNKAYRGLKSSQLEDIALIYKSFLLLRDFYVPTRRVGGVEQKRAFDDACRELGVEEAESISRSRAGEEGDTYFVNYGGKRMLLDRHLRKGDARDSRYCFRLYFFWDDDEEQVVVGWLPSHLDTRST